MNILEEQLETTEVRLGEVIASRRLKFSRRGKSPVTVNVRIGRPRHWSSRSTDFICPFRVTGLGKPISGALYGVDSLQALLLTLQVLPAVIGQLTRQHKGVFTWLGNRNVDLALVTDPPGRA